MSHTAGRNGVHICRSKTAILAIAGAFLLTSVAISEEPSKPNGPCVLSGEVVTEDGHAVSGAQVSLLESLGSMLSLSSMQWASHSTVSDKEGKFEFKGLPETKCLLAAHKSGFAAGVRFLVTNPSQSPQLVEVVLARSKPFTLIVTDPAGKPLDGASLNEVSWNSPNGRSTLRRWQAKSLGIRWPESNQQGKLQLNLFPGSSEVSGNVDHPKYAPAEIPKVAVDATVPSHVQLQHGTEFILKLAGRGVDIPRQDFRLDLWRIDGNVRQFSQEPIEFNEQHEFRTVLGPGKYHILMRHPSLQTLPANFDDLDIASGAATQFEIAVIPRGTVTGRILRAASGKPFPGRYVEAFVHAPNDQNDAYGMGPGWYYSARAFSDGEGRHSIHPGVGDIRIILQPGTPDRKYVAETQYLEVGNVGAEKVAAAPDMRLYEYPVISGFVRRDDGSPVPFAILKGTGEHRFAKPAIADREGRFRFQVEQLGYAKHSYVDVRAFDPLGPWEKQFHLPVDVRKSTNEMDLTVQRAEIETPPVPETGNAGDTKSLVGKAAPELISQAALNWAGDPPHISQFRGKYVLIYFWATWCGPCISKLPAVESVAEIYKDKNLAVITVHHNSVTAPEIQAFIDKQKLKLPTFLDAKDESTYRSYGADGSVALFVLLDPQGRVVLTSNENREAFYADLHATLRSFMLHGKK